MGTPRRPMRSRRPGPSRWRRTRGPRDRNGPSPWDRSRPTTPRTRGGPRARRAPTGGRRTRRRRRRRPGPIPTGARPCRSPRASGRRRHSPPPRRLRRGPIPAGPRPSPPRTPAGNRGRGTTPCRRHRRRPPPRGRPRPPPRGRPRPPPRGRPRPGARPLRHRRRRPRRSIRRRGCGRRGSCATALRPRRRTANAPATRSRWSWSRCRTSPSPCSRTGARSRSCGSWATSSWRVGCSTTSSTCRTGPSTGLPSCCPMSIARTRRCSNGGCARASAVTSAAGACRSPSWRARRSRHPTTIRRWGRSGTLSRHAATLVARATIARWPTATDPARSHHPLEPTDRVAGTATPRALRSMNHTGVICPQAPVDDHAVNWWAGSLRRESAGVSGNGRGSFTHLHVHTEYSMLDGAARIGEVVEAAVADGQPALGITDHGNMYGILDFYKECRKQGIKPILGTEAYMAHDSRHERPAWGGRVAASGGVAGGGQKLYYHLTLLAESNVGYRNLIQLASRAFMEGYYYKPRVDWETLADHSEGLIATTGCLGGHVLQSL